MLSKQLTDKLPCPFLIQDKEVLFECIVALIFTHSPLWPHVTEKWKTENLGHLFLSGLQSFVVVAGEVM